MSRPPPPPLSFSCGSVRHIALLPAHRTALSLLCCADIAGFSATQHRRDTDNPEKTPVGPLLLRCLALLALSVAGLLCHVAALTGSGSGSGGGGGGSGSRYRPLAFRSFVLWFSQSFAVVAASVWLVSALLSPHPAAPSLLPSAVFALHAAYLSLPPSPPAAPTLSTPSVWLGSMLPASGDSVPLLCSWLSCYWLALDHDDKLQVWPLAALLALHTSHALVAVTRTLRSHFDRASGEDNIKAAFV